MDDKLDRLDLAINEILKVRKLNSTTDTDARDAEYYLYGARAALSGDPLSTIFTLGTPAYVALKALAKTLGLQNLTQADPDKVNSAPGGTLSAWKGLIDGYSGEVDSRLQVYQRNAELLLFSTDDFTAADAAAPDDSFVYYSRLDFYTPQHTTIDLFNSSDVPDDAKSQVIIDHDYSNPLNLGSGNNFVFGGDGSNHVSATAGNNVLFGLGGDDELTGGTGKDIVDGGTGDEHAGRRRRHRLACWRPRERHYDGWRHRRYF